jgi:hypothetical protein
VRIPCFSASAMTFWASCFAAVREIVSGSFGSGLALTGEFGRSLSDFGLTGAGRKSILGLREGTVESRGAEDLWSVVGGIGVL